jgi:hypothetical protein
LFFGITRRSQKNLEVKSESSQAPADHFIHVSVFLVLCDETPELEPALFFNWKK